MNRNIFRAYDVRGRYPTEINANDTFQIVLSLGKYFKEKGVRRVVVARDGRRGSLAMFKKATNALRTSGLKVVKVGLATTPMFYFLVNQLSAGGGIMITASHNPKEWNGLKAVERKAIIMPGSKVLKIMEKYERK